MKNSTKGVVFMLLLACFYVSPSPVSGGRIPGRDEEESRVVVASGTSSHRFVKCNNKGSGGCGSEFQAEKLHSVPSGPNPVGNSLPGKLLVTRRRSPPPFPQGLSPQP